MAWEKTRVLFRRRYQLEYLIVSYEPGRWNFSDNTDLSEVLVVARRLHNEKGGEEADCSVICVTLWRNPASPVEALGIAHAILKGGPPDVAQGQGALSIVLGESKFGEAVSAPWAEIRDGSWLLGCAFGQHDLLRATYHLAGGRLWFPGQGIVASIPLRPLGELGDLGPDRRDIHDGFSLAKGPTSYPAFWSHDATAMATIAQEPNAYLDPLSKAKEKRPLRKVEDLWPKAGRLLVAERLRLNTQRLIAVRVSERVLSNVWWPVALRDEEASRVLALWLNSTLGLVLFMAHREETEGAWVAFKKPVLTAMPVLDVEALSADQRRALADAYDLLCREPLLPFPEMAQDSTRQLIDDAICQVLGLPDVSPLRQLLAREPIVCLRPLV